MHWHNNTYVIICVYMADTLHNMPTHYSLHTLHEDSSMIELLYYTNCTYSTVEYISTTNVGYCNVVYAL